MHFKIDVMIERHHHLGVSYKVKLVEFKLTTDSQLSDQRSFLFKFSFTFLESHHMETIKYACNQIKIMEDNTLHLSGSSPHSLFTKSTTLGNENIHLKLVDFKNIIHPCRVT